MAKQTKPWQCQAIQHEEVIAPYPKRSWRSLRMLTQKDVTATEESTVIITYRQQTIRIIFV